MKAKGMVVLVYESRTLSELYKSFYVMIFVIIKLECGNIILLVFVNESCTLTSVLCMVR